MFNFNKEEFEADCVRWFTNPEKPLSVCKHTNQCGDWEKRITRKLKEGWVLISKNEAQRLNQERKRLYRASGLTQEQVGDIIFIRNVPNPATATPDIVNSFTYGPHGMTSKNVQACLLNTKGQR